jgi:hypothetical protein
MKNLSSVSILTFVLISAPLLATSPIFLDAGFSLWKVFAWILIAGFMLISVPIGVIVIVAILGSVFMSLMGGKAAMMSNALHNPGKSLAPIKMFMSAALTLGTVLSSSFFLWAWTNVFSMGYDNRSVLFGGAILGFLVAFFILNSAKRMTASYMNKNGFSSFTNMNQNRPNNRTALDDEEDIQVF